jgi:hypothetical protein
MNKTLEESLANLTKKFEVVKSNGKNYKKKARDFEK